MDGDNPGRMEGMTNIAFQNLHSKYMTKPVNLRKPCGWILLITLTYMTMKSMLLKIITLMIKSGSKIRAVALSVSPNPISIRLLIQVTQQLYHIVYDKIHNGYETFANLIVLCTV